jgi:hypothetical protein
MVSSNCHAEGWTDDLYMCTANYLSDSTYAWSVYNDSGQTESDYDTLTNRLNAAFDSYHTCNTWAPVPQFDYCYGAQLAAENCAIQFSGSSDLGAVMECRNATRVDQCE